MATPLLVDGYGYEALGTGTGMGILCHGGIDSLYHGLAHMELSNGDDGMMVGEREQACGFWEMG